MSVWEGDGAWPQADRGHSRTGRQGAWGDWGVWRVKQSEYGWQGQECTRPDGVVTAPPWVGEAVLFNGAGVQGDVVI